MGLAFSAAVAAGQSAASADQLDAEYKFYWKGLLVSSAETQLKTTDETYDFALDFRMRGVAKLFANGRSKAKVSGRLNGDDAMPLQYQTDGRWDGDDYAQTMTFDTDGSLIDQKLDWPEDWIEDNKREPVPEEMQRGPDPASLVVKLVSTPLEQTTGGTPFKVRSFDGDSVFEYGITCQPEPVILEPSSHSPYSGEAYECGFGGELFAGKRILTEKQKKKAEKRRRKAEKRRAKGKKDEEDIPPKLWVQSFQNGAYLLPVRAELSTGMGKVRMYLSSLTVLDTEDINAASLEAPERPTKTASSR
jgi:hypothetical protein